MLPSATEIVCAVGAEADLVGISHECDFPDSVRRLPALTRARVEAVSATAKLVHQPIRIVNLHPTRLGDIWDDILRVADALGRTAEGVEVVADLQRRVSEVARRPAICPDRPRVVSIE